MDRTLMWSRLDRPGSEHLHVRDADGGVIADGMVIALVDGTPSRLAYQVACDARWNTRYLAVQLDGDVRVTLSRDGERWTDATGAEHPELKGCVDVDIALTPFTNTLPIRRLDLHPGESADLRAVYVRFTPDLEITTSDQRYTRHEPGAEADYRYTSGSFAADLRVNADGFVTDYPGLWTLTCQA